MSSEVTLEGMDVLLARLRSLGAQTERLEDKALLSGGKVLQKAIGEAAPRSITPRQPKSTQPSQRWRTGKHSGENIKITRVKTSDYGNKSVSVGISKGDTSKYFYLKFFEWGSSKMSAKPFMDPAARKSEIEVLEAMNEVFQEGFGI